ncbi:MAG: hypothetical protein QNK23_09475 [Crocinitomicaceae bacterium]|nr:hypothetical protein [Crocinitomicaceae bacterium]
METVVEIVEEYLSKRALRDTIPHEELKRRLMRAGVQESSVHEITIELIDDWDREELALLKDKNSKRNVIFGAVVLLLSLIVAVLSALGIFPQGKMGLYMFGVMAAGILAISTGIVHLQKAKLRIDRRRIKWQVWDKKSR